MSDGVTRKVKATSRMDGTRRTQGAGEENPPATTEVRQGLEGETPKSFAGSHAAEKNF